LIRTHSLGGESLVLRQPQGVQNSCFLTRAYRKPQKDQIIYETQSDELKAVYSQPQQQGAKPPQKTTTTAPLNINSKPFQQPQQQNVQPTRSSSVPPPMTPSPSPSTAAPQSARVLNQQPPTRVQQTPNVDVAPRKFSEAKPPPPMQQQPQQQRQQQQQGTAAGSSIVVPPSQHHTLIGWCGEITREEAESKLGMAPPQTFLVRWSSRANGYVLSYKGKKGEFIHLAQITPEAMNRNSNSTVAQIKVVNVNGTESIYPSLYDLVLSSQREGIILHPIGMFDTTYSPM